MDDNDDYDDDTIPGDYVHFEGPCTCEHEQEEHGWGGCNIDGCNCEAGWEE